MRACPVCAARSSVEYKPSDLAGPPSSEDFKISDSRYGRTARIVRCRDCGLLYADPLPTDDIVSMYAGMQDAEYDDGSEGRGEPFNRILSTCRKLRPEARTLLDVGASTGILCAAAGRIGLEATGVDPSAWAVRVAREKRNQNVVLGRFPSPELAGRRFDIVTLVDVIEHVVDPVGLLRDAAAALSPGGLVVVVTPDVSSLAARAMGRRWWHFRVAHISYFSRATMRLALGQAGLAVEKTQPYTWFFTVGYVATRLGRYLPVGPVNRLLSRTAPGRSLFATTFPLNLGDSDIYYASTPACGG